MTPERRGKNVAIVGIAVQLILAVVMLLIWRWSGSQAAFVSMLMSAGGIPLWLMVTFLLYCRQLQQQEQAELEEFASQGATSGTIFERGEDLGLRPAAARAAFADKWLVPIFTLLWAGYHAAIGVLVFTYLRATGSQNIGNVAQGMLITLVAGFAAFLFSRYTTGMSKGPHGHLLRATGSYLLVNVLVLAGVLGGLIGAYRGNLKIDLVVAFVVTIVQVVLAIELVLNFMLDLYRPRIPGQEHRPSFDSRLLNLIAEPERVGHSIAETLNYQFGFEVSKTWFYQLLSRAFIPLLVFAGMVLLAMSSIVLVREGEQYVVMHWGRVDRVLDPGIHLKWPWPVDTADRFATGRVQEIMLGVGRERKHELIQGREVSLWTKEHGHRSELDFLLAVPPRSTELTTPEGQEPPPPVNIIKLAVTLEYVIDDVYKFGYRYNDPAKILECIGYSEMLQYCASATLNSPVGAEATNRPEAIMTYGRGRAAKELKRLIQNKADEYDLGVKIQHVGLDAVHPPSQAAEAYQAVLEAERRMLLTRYEAEAQANRTLVQVAGRPLTALKLALAIQTIEELQELRDDPSQSAVILATQIRRAEKDIGSLQKEIGQERLFGKTRQDGSETSKQNLLAEQQNHLALLRKIQADPTALGEQLASAHDVADKLFDRTVGEPARIEAEAQAYRWDQNLKEMARAWAFKSELLAYRASPRMYMTDRWLEVWDEVLPGIKKYVIGVDRDKLEIWLNWERETAFMEGAYLEDKQE